MSYVDVSKVGAMFIDMSKPAERRVAFETGLVNPQDSPTGFLCTLCGAMVAATDQHTEYHRGQKNFMEGILIKLGALK